MRQRFEIAATCLAVVKGEITKERGLKKIMEIGYPLPLADMWINAAKALSRDTRVFA